MRRETYIGPWLPEPVDTSADPHLGAERGEALEFAALLLMEKLTPNERAAYVLREAFDHPSTWFWDDIEVRWANTNGQTSAVLLRDGAVYAVLAVTASAEGIDHLLWMVNPDKITAVRVPG